MKQTVIYPYSIIQTKWDQKLYTDLLHFHFPQKLFSKLQKAEKQKIPLRIWIFSVTALKNGSNHIIMIKGEDLQKVVNSYLGNNVSLYSPSIAYEGLLSNNLQSSPLYFIMLEKLEEEFEEEEWHITSPGENPQWVVKAIGEKLKSKLFNSWNLAVSRTLAKIDQNPFTKVEVSHNQTVISCPRPIKFHHQLYHKVECEI